MFNCLRSWLTAGEVNASALAETPLFAYAFEALGSDDLFDVAVDVICDLIHETQEIDDNMDVIQLIVPRVIALQPQLQEQADDPDKIKGFAKIFAEAGETYRLLVLQHTETFFPIVKAIGECSAYSDLDIVPITFPFWMRLAQSIGKKPSVSPLFLDAYRTLMRVIIGHLHFPVDIATMPPQEADNFRAFRHVMGDTLKDCCFVLGANSCLLATYDMITTALSRNADALSWQEIEAPLFAMRSMGAEVDPNDNEMVPKIMDLIPSLPNHPRVRYAATLIISRYTEWINLHPDYIQYQLQYISAGFEDPDTEVSGAAGHALKYLCQDCKQVSGVSWSREAIFNIRIIAPSRLFTDVAHIPWHDGCQAGTGGQAPSLPGHCICYICHAHGTGRIISAHILFGHSSADPCNHRQTHTGHQVGTSRSCQ